MFRVCNLHHTVSDHSEDLVFESQQGELSNQLTNMLANTHTYTYTHIHTHTHTGFGLGQTRADRKT